MLFNFGENRRTVGLLTAAVTSDAGLKNGARCFGGRLQGVQQAERA